MTGSGMAYSQTNAPPGCGPEWVLEATGSEIRATSRWTPGEDTVPVTLTFDTRRCYATLLGLFNPNGDIALPAVLHLPGFGSFRIGCSAGSNQSVGYSSGAG